MHDRTRILTLLASLALASTAIATHAAPAPDSSSIVQARGEVRAEDPDAAEIARAKATIARAKAHRALERAKARTARAHAAADRALARARAADAKLQAVEAKLQASK